MTEGPFTARFSVELEGFGRTDGERNDIEKLRARLERYIRTWFHDDDIEVVTHSVNGDPIGEPT